MAQSPIKINDTNQTNETTRETLFKEESDKILYRKGPVFFHYITNNQKFSPFKPSNSPLSNSHIEIPHDNKFVQPSMRFKPRTDMERIYETMLANGHPKSPKPRNAVDKQLYHLGLSSVRYLSSHEKFFKKTFGYTKYDNDKETKEKNLSNGNLTISSLNSVNLSHKTNDNFINDNNNNTIYNNKNSNEKQKMINCKYNVNDSNKNKILNAQKLKKIDNSEAKILFHELHDKTYFKAIEHYPLFGSSCFVTNYNKNKDKKGKNRFIMSYSTKNMIKNTHRNLNFESLKSGDNNKHNQNAIDFIYLFNEINTSKRENLLSCLDNIKNFQIDLEKKAEESEREIDNDKINILRKMAFVENKGNSKDDNEIEFNKRRSFVKDPMIDNIKGEKHIVIDGVKYAKTDVKNISKKVLEKCNWVKKKQENYERLHKSFSGKLMFTQGMSVNDFVKKYHLKT